ncbi:MAG TPA: glycoside hydrolase family 38 C-terminal domain-containing protein [Acidimicrobiales bacterium]|nr:glycoside hydrolase family 38 C-terminal domain-containing protein [Acidimicrobiales bacterium]
MITRLHLVGHAHIDPAWLWRWPEGLSEVLATFRAALDRIEEHSQFVFSCGSAAFYEFVERADPAMFAEIATAARYNRWEILGGFWVEPDTNVTSGEALVRHALVSQRWFRCRFGRAPTVAFNPDAFGHSAGLPQILARSGFRSYVFMRPGPAEADLPTTFRWASADGSAVRAYRIPVGYNAGPETLEDHLAAVRTTLTADGEEEGMCFYGVGNHGGGPTRANLAQLDAHIAGGEALSYSAPHRYFATARPLHEHRGELGYHARGAYSADSDIKAAIRRTDAALIGAEGAASLAGSLAGFPYPQADLDQAWKALLRCGAHDIAAGTAIPSATRDALEDLHAAAATAGRICDESYVTLAWHTALRARPDHVTLVVFNPHPWTNHLPVETEVGIGAGPLSLTDDWGSPVPVQEIDSEAVAVGRRRITFLATLPGCGSAVYHLTAGSADPAPTRPWRWDLHLDGGTGGVSRLTFDGRPVLSGPSAYTVVSPDRSDTWSHGVDGYAPSEDTFTGAGITAVEDGPVRRVWRTVARCGGSSITQRYVLYAGWDRLLVEVTCDWSERQAVGKLRFATALGARVVMEAPYSCVEREPDGREYPGGAWFLAAGPGGGYSLANDAKFAYDVQPGSLGITVARSPMAAHHDPAVPRPGAEAGWLDQGVQRFTWVIGGDPDPLAAARMAAELLRRPAVVVGSHHPDAPLQPGTGNVVVHGAILGALKRSEDGGGTVVRVHNPSPLYRQAEVSFLGRHVRRPLAPTEVATLYFPNDPDQPAREARLTEMEA